MKHALCLNGSWIDESSTTHAVISAYVGLRYNCSTRGICPGRECLDTGCLVWLTTPQHP